MTTQVCRRRPRHGPPPSAAPEAPAVLQSSTEAIAIPARVPSATVPATESGRRRRRPITVELRTVSEPLSEEELRWREQELERLIIKAACHRAARLAAVSALERLGTEERPAIAS